MLARARESPRLVLIIGINFPSRSAGFSYRVAREIPSRFRVGARAREAKEFAWRAWDIKDAFALPSVLDFPLFAAKKFLPYTREPRLSISPILTLRLEFSL